MNDDTTIIILQFGILGLIVMHMGLNIFFVIMVLIFPIWSYYLKKRNYFNYTYPYNFLRFSAKRVQKNNLYMNDEEIEIARKKSAQMIVRKRIVYLAKLYKIPRYKLFNEAIIAKDTLFICWVISGLGVLISTILEI